MNNNCKGCVIVWVPSAVVTYYMRTVRKYLKPLIGELALCMGIIPIYYIINI